MTVPCVAPGSFSLHLGAVSVGFRDAGDTRISKWKRFSKGGNLVKRGLRDLAWRAVYTQESCCFYFDCVGDRLGDNPASTWYGHRLALGTVR